MDCQAIADRNPPIATGALHVEEGLVLFAYVGTIALLILGPSHIAANRWRRIEKDPPWYLEKTVYAPLLGFIYASLVNYFRGRKRSLVTGLAIRETLAAKIPIILLILSFAYLSISLDISGFFSVTASYVVSVAKGDGVRLLVYIFILCSLLTYFTSNDIVILSMTPLLCHVGEYSGIKNIIPLLITQFIAANTASMGLLIGSPTNIILGDAVKLSFGRYWLLMVLPTVVAVGTTIFMLLFVFVWHPTRGNVMQRRFTQVNLALAPPEDESPSSSLPQSGHQGGLVDGVGPELTPAAVSHFNDHHSQQQQQEASTVALEVPGSYGGGLVDGADLEMTSAAVSSQPDHHHHQQQQQQQQEDSSIVALEVQDHYHADPEEATAHPPPIQEEDDDIDAVSFGGTETMMLQHKTRIAKVIVFMTVLFLLSISSLIGAELWSVSFGSACVMLMIDLSIVYSDGGSLLSFLSQVYHRMPWSIAPFVLCMFLLVQVLTDTGFTGRFAAWMIAAAGPNVWTQSLVFGYISAILVNCFNDLPSTVFWSNMVGIFCQHYSKRSYHVIIMSLLVGVNPGCYMTVIGALAGLVWRSIIITQPSAAKLIVPTAWDLTYYGVMVLGPVILLCSLSICLVTIGI